MIKVKKGDTSNVVLPNKSVKKILDKIESCSVPAFFSGREEHMCNADKFDAFLKKAQKGEKDSIVVYEVHEDGGIGRNKYIFDGQNMYVLYVGSVWNDDEELQFDNVIITDAMNMKVITKFYDADQAAVMAIEAGNDMILMPDNFEQAFEGVLEAVKDGTLSESQIDEAAGRVLSVKIKRGILPESSKLFRHNEGK